MIPTKWEYKVLSTKDHDYISLERELNKLGSDGWEIMAGNYTTKGRSSASGHAEQVETVILKREKVKDAGA